MSRVAVPARVLALKSAVRSRATSTTRAAWLQLRRYEIFDGNLPDEDEEDIPPPDDPQATSEAAAPEAPAATTDPQ